MITRSVLSIAFLCAAAFGQKKSVDKPRDPVSLDFTVTGPAGQFVTGLTAGDFELFQDDKRLKVLKAVHVQKQADRTLVLVVDDLGLWLDGFQRVKQALRKFVMEQLRPGDRVAIVRTGMHAGAIQQFTSDPTVLDAAMDRLDFNPLHDPTDRRPASFASGTLLQLGFIMKGLKEMPERKAVILFSERFGVSRSADAATLANIEASAIRISDYASQAKTVLHVIDASPSPRPPIQLETRLAGAVKDTGGLWIDGSADVFASLQRVLEDQAQHYLVEFVSEASSYDYRFEKMAVKVARPGLQVRARRVVYGKSDDVLETFYASSDDDKESTLTSPFDGGAIAVRGTPLFFHSASEGSYLDIILHIDAKQLTFTRNLSGQYKCNLEISSAAFDAGGQTAGEASRGAAYAVMEAGLPGLLEGGIIYTQRLPIRRPGAYQVRVAVLDEATGRVGSAGLYIEIPDVKGGDLAMSGIILRPNRTSPDDARTAMRENSAVRIFQPNSTFAYGYQIYNLTANESKKMRTEVQARLLRDGVEIFIGKPTNIEFDGSPTSGAVNGSIALAEGAIPGRYTLQITASDKLADKPRAASQWIDLEVRP